MKRFIAFACLLVSAHCASLLNDEATRDVNFIRTNLKGAENILSALESQINHEVENNPNLRREPSEIEKIRSDMVHLYSQLNHMRSLTKSLERQLGVARTRRDVDGQNRQNVVVETTQTVVNSAANGIQSTLNTLNNLMININRGVNNLFNRLTNQITNVAVSANNAAQSGVQSINNGAQAAITNANNAATAVVSTVYNGVNNAAQGVGTAIQSSYQAVSSAAANGINAAANTVNRLTG